MVCFKNIASGVMVMCICVSVQPKYVYTTFDLDLPGVDLTRVMGIDGGAIVGSYIFTALDGFLYDGSTYTTLTVPWEAYSTQVYGIDGSNIVGVYQDASGHYGFLYDGLTYTTLDVPGASDAITGLVRSETMPRVWWPAESGRLIVSRQANRTLHFAMPGRV